MQEHIRRAHPEHYISKLPATEESFQLMITTPPTEKPPAPQNQSTGNTAFGHDREAATADYSSSPAAARNLSEYPAAATAAVALAQLHSHRPDSDWESEADYISENERSQPNTQSSIELPPIQNHVNPDNMPPFHSPRPRELLPSIMARSPPGSGGRSSTLPPIHRRDKAARPRKSSITQNNRKPKTERPKSKEYARRLSVEGRKAFSAEPQAVGKRWEDLIEAATSANEADSDRDLTPIPQSPSSVKRSSLPPFSSMVPHSDAYKASPLQNALTPPPPDERGVEPFPSIESAQSSLASGHNFHMHPSGLTNSEAGTSPTLPPHPVQIYCAHCRRISNLKESYACTECISGFCSDCVYTLSSEQNRGRACPRCKVLGPRYKAFQLDLR
ncbi:MAG: hypothetical protein LQ342_004047 [Letrouitia transgressa]|nr:MAG: hypothetical protein LQ342_004047 [Letrouitia transgressa]